MPHALLTAPPLNPSRPAFPIGGTVIDPVQPLPKRKHKVLAVLPAYHAEKTLAATIADFPAGSVDEILLVDDCSKDGTAELAREMGLSVIVHDQNTGYGGNQKTCYRYALEHGLTK